MSTTSPKNKGIKRENEQVEDSKLVKKPGFYEKNKGIKRENEQVEDSKLVKKPGFYEKNKGIKRWNEQVEDSKLVKKPGFYEKKQELHFAKVVAKMSDDNFPYCNKVEDYEKLDKIGEGTFGVVFKARHLTSNKVVALKRVRTENTNEGFPITSLREIKILQRLKNKNVVNLIDTCRSKKPTSGSCPIVSFYLVFEFCEHDLAGLISNRNVKFTLKEIKGVLKQLFNGLYFIHSSHILHRDIKAANILITKNGELKIADFGLARPISQKQAAENRNKFTNNVITLWYRPPELLLGERNYGPPVDLWGSGCVMAEMWTRKPILQDCVKDPLALDLLDKLLTIDPAKRIDSDNALLHDFFWTDPFPGEFKSALQPITESQFVYRPKKGNDVRCHGAGPSRVHPTADDGCHERVF